MKKVIAVLLMVAMLICLCSCGDSNEDKYNHAVSDVMSGNYDKAITAFEALNGYQDSAKYIMYAKCLKAGDSGEYEAAIKSLQTLGDFKEASMYIKYYTALSYEAEQQYEDALDVYEEILLFKDVQERSKQIPDKIIDRELAKAIDYIDNGRMWGMDLLSDVLDKRYSNSDSLLFEKVMEYAKTKYDARNYETAAQVYLYVVDKGYAKAEAPFKAAVYAIAEQHTNEGDYEYAVWLINEYLPGYNGTYELLNECNYQLTIQKVESRGSDAAQEIYDAFKALGTYKDSAERAKAYEDKYNSAIAKRSSGAYDAAIAEFTQLGTYSDAAAQITETKYQAAAEAAAALMNEGKYEEAIGAFKALNGYGDSTEQILECRYRMASELMKNRDYAGAGAIFITIKGYKDVDSLLENDENLSAAAAALEAKWQAGNYVTFGTYPQTKVGNDNTPIEWLVLARDGDKALVISRYALDCVSYNTKYTDVTWETCSLRTWLNNDFYNKAFSAEEKESIVLSKVTADKNPEYSTNPGNDTTDNVFLLSIPEVNTYFKDDTSRRCAPTDFAVKNGALKSSSYEADGRESCWWWLRSPGRNSTSAAFGSDGGPVFSLGNGVDSNNRSVRPCVWVWLF